MRHLGARLSALIDGELSGAQRERVLSHLARCEPCREEAAALRVLKRRMHALGGAATGNAPNWRLIALAASGAQPGHGFWPAHAGRGRRARPLLVAGGAALAVAGLSLSAAAFLGGRSQPPGGPRVVPALGVFMVQHAITTGEVPVQPASQPPAPPAFPPGVP